MSERKLSLLDDDGGSPGDDPSDPVCTPPTDEELVRRLEAGDRSAVAEVTVRYRDHVFAYHAGRFRTPEWADDMTQETFIRLYRYMQRPAILRRGADSLVSLLDKIAWRVGCRHIRRTRKEERDQRQYAIFPIDEPPTTDSTVLAKELSGIFRRAVEELPPALRSVATLYYFEFKTPGQIAELTGLPLNTVDVYLHRARKRLRTILSPYWKGKDHV